MSEKSESAQGFLQPLAERVPVGERQRSRPTARAFGAGRDQLVVAAPAQRLAAAGAECRQVRF